jgi:predicted glycosyltransferase
MKKSSPPVIVSPLNWGLGHASRCIPLIRELQRSDFEPVLAGDGRSLDLLSAEFPALKIHKLPSYNIRYSKDPAFFMLKLLMQGPHLVRLIAREREAIEKIVELERPVGIISDNRFGVRSSKVPSVYLTHQLQVRAGTLSRMATRWHQRIISGFDQCWVCDDLNDKSLAGELSSDERKVKHAKWIGPLSRFSPGKAIEKDVDIAVVLSGPEPARRLFQEKVIAELKGSDERIVLVEGVIGSTQNKRQKDGFTIYNYMLSEELESLINRSRIVISRAGYSSIMDLNAMGAKALLIPTPGQTEQEYLATNLEEKGICHQVRQNEFRRESIERAKRYPGFETKKISKSDSFEALFDIFRQRRSIRSKE